MAIRSYLYMSYWKRLAIGLPMGAYPLCNTRLYLHSTRSCFYASATVTASINIQTIFGNFVDTSKGCVSANFGRNLRTGNTIYCCFLIDDHIFGWPYLSNPCFLFDRYTFRVITLVFTVRFGSNFVEMFPGVSARGGMSPNPLKWGWG